MLDRPSTSPQSVLSGEDAGSSLLYQGSQDGQGYTETCESLLHSALEAIQVHTGQQSSRPLHPQGQAYCSYIMVARLTNYTVVSKLANTYTVEHLNVDTFRTREECPD